MTEADVCVSNLPRVITRQWAGQLSGTHDISVAIATPEQPHHTKWERVGQIGDFQPISQRISETVQGYC